MGNIQGSTCKLSTSEITAYTTDTVFTKEEIRALWFHFNSISGGQDTIKRSQFQAAMLFRESALLDRIFYVFDTDDDGSISFSEYVSCLSIISSKTPQEEKLKFSFRIYDNDGDGRISSADLTTVLQATLREHDLVISRTEIDQLVEQTVKEAHPATADRITYEEYRQLVSVRPHLLTHLTLNISSIISEYTKSTGMKFETPRI